MTDAKLQSCSFPTQVEVSSKETPPALTFFYEIVEKKINFWKMQVHPSTSQVAKARNYYLDAEKATSFEKKRVLYLAAAKEYLEAATTITNDELKRSLGYLSISCAQKASSYSLVEEIVAPAKESYDPAAVLHTERLLFLAHLENKRRIELVRYWFIDVILFLFIMFESFIVFFFLF